MVVTVKDRYRSRGEIMPAATTAAVGQELVSHCPAGKNIEAIEKLYSPTLVFYNMPGA